MVNVSYKIIGIYYEFYTGKTRKDTAEAVCTSKTKDAGNKEQSSAFRTVSS